MRFFTHATLLYEFLRLCQLSPLEKNVLDCGAGGKYPPLSIFFENGYKTYGIDNSTRAIELANKFCEKHNIELEITKGDIREINFGNESISFIYTYNTIMHLKKSDTVIAMKEIERVLKKNGLCYVNFQSTSSDIPDLGEEIRKGEYLKVYPDGEEVLHSLYNDNEPDHYFKNFNVIHKEKRILYRTLKEQEIIIADLNYIAQKNE